MIPLSGVVGGMNLECIGAWRKVGIVGTSHTIIGSNLLPRGVKAFQLITVICLGGVYVIERREFKSEEILPIVEHDFFGSGNGLF